MNFVIYMNSFYIPSGGGGEGRVGGLGVAREARGKPGRTESFGKRSSRSFTWRLRARKDSASETR